VNCFWDGNQPKELFIGWHGREKFGCFSREEGGIFLIFQGIILLVVWDGVFGESGWVFFSFFFCDMVT
jgi:hypothetical protein